MSTLILRPEVAREGQRVPVGDRVRRSQGAAADVAEISARDVQGLAATLRTLGPRQGRARLVGPEGESMELPEPIYQLLRQVAAALHLGQGVVVMPLHSLLTTNEAAEILNVSRPHLIKQLDAGAISFERVGTHRRIRLSDLLDYKEQRDADRREALEALAHQAEDLNLDY